jgi:hypothetical protein
MPKGPRGERRPADTNACAVMVAKIATGEVEDNLPSGRRISGLAGGKARRDTLSPARRREIAKKAALTRWGRIGG